MTQLSRRDFCALAAGGVLFGFSNQAEKSSIVVEKSGTMEEMLAQGGRAILNQWPIGGVPYSYIAAFDGIAIPLRPDITQGFRIRHNGVVVTEPFANRRVKPGDQISVTIVDC